MKYDASHSNEGEKHIYNPRNGLKHNKLPTAVYTACIYSAYYHGQARDGVEELGDVRRVNIVFLTPIDGGRVVLEQRIKGCEVIRNQAKEHCKNNVRRFSRQTHPLQSKVNCFNKVSRFRTNLMAFRAGAQVLDW